MFEDGDQKDEFLTDVLQKNELSERMFVFFFMCQKGKLRTIVCSHVFSMCLSELSDDCLTGSNCSAGGRVLCLAHRGVKASGVLLHAARHNDVGAKFEFGKTHSLQHGAI